MFIFINIHVYNVHIYTHMHTNTYLNHFAICLKHCKPAITTKIKKKKKEEENQGYLLPSLESLALREETAMS